MSTQERIIVEFTKSWRGYSEGEVAGFAAKEAAVLIEAGAAKEHSGKPQATQAAAPARKPRAAQSKPATDAAGKPDAPADPVTSTDPVDGGAAQSSEAPAADPVVPPVDGSDDERP